MRHSAPLAERIERKREAQVNVEKLIHIDEETFVRFCQWAYTGDYESAQLPPVPQETPLPDVDVKSSGRGWNSKKRPAASVDEGCCYCGRSPDELPRSCVIWNELRHHSSSSLTCCEKRKKMEESIDLTEVFLCHTRVYIFAKHFDIAHLRSFALENLETALQVFKPHTGRMCDIIGLAMFTYNNKNTANSKIGEELDH